MSAEVLNATTYPWPLGMNDSESATESSNDCNQFPFDTASFKIVAIVRACAGLFSFLCCIGIIMVIIFCRKYHFFRHRLILYLAIAAMLHSLAFTVGRVEFESHRPIEDNYCYFAGFFEILTSWIELLSICCLTFNLFAITVRRKLRTENLESFYLIVTFVLPFFWCWIPFIAHSYGSSGPWCGIRSTSNNCHLFHFGNALRFIIWEVPFYIIFLVILIASISIAIKIRRDTHVWEGTIDPLAQFRKQEIEKEVKPLLWYPIVYLIPKIFLLISHIYDATHPHTPKLYLWVLRALSSPFAGAFIALVYTMDRETRSRLRPNLVKAACMSLCCTVCRKNNDVKTYEADMTPMEYGDSLECMQTGLYYRVTDRITTGV